MRPKLAELTGKDDLRPFFKFGLLTKEHIVVSNAFALVAHKTKSIFDNDFVASIPTDKAILIPAVTLKEMNKKGVTYSLKAGEIPEMEFKLKNNSYSHKLEYDGVNDKYPDWESVIPEKFEEEMGKVFAFNASLLNTIMQAINPDSEIVHLKSSGVHRAIGVFDSTNTYDGCRAILMPCEIRM